MTDLDQMKVLYGALGASAARTMDDLARAALASGLPEKTHKLPIFETSEEYFCRFTHPTCADDYGRHMTTAELESFPAGRAWLGAFWAEGGIPR